MERMEVTGDVAAYKRATGKPVLDRARERDNIQRASEAVPPELSSYAAAIQAVLMEASRAAQHKMLGVHGDVSSRVSQALATQPTFFPLQARVATQGVEGAYQQIAVNRLFRRAQIDYYGSYEQVFEAVESGACQFGVLPIENSTAGSVNRVFDLMAKHSFHIVRTCRLKIEHNLLVKPGTSKDDVRIVYSHEQALRQCAGYLSGMPDAKVHVCENTAMAALKVQQSERDDVAAIASRDCAAIYGLEVCERGVQDQDDNYTRFACIARDLTIYPGADRSSFMAVLPHEPGALYQALAKFYALGINLIKIESRPLPNRAFEFLFYFDIEYPAAAPQFLTLVDSLQEGCDECRYLGSYSEVV